MPKFVGVKTVNVCINTLCERSTSGWALPLAGACRIARSHTSYDNQMLEGRQSSWMGDWTKDCSGHGESNTLHSTQASHSYWGMTRTFVARTTYLASKSKACSYIHSVIVVYVVKNFHVFLSFCCCPGQYNYFHINFSPDLQYVFVVVGHWLLTLIITTKLLMTV